MWGAGRAPRPPPPTFDEALRHRVLAHNLPDSPDQAPSRRCRSVGEKKIGGRGSVQPHVLKLVCGPPPSPGRILERNSGIQEDHFLLLSGMSFCSGPTIANSRTDQWPPMGFGYPYPCKSDVYHIMTICGAHNINAIVARKRDFWHLT